jgi:transposase-like protein
MSLYRKEILTKGGCAIISRHCLRKIRSMWRTCFNRQENQRALIPEKRALAKKVQWESKDACNEEFELTTPLACVVDGFASAA